SVPVARAQAGARGPADRAQRRDRLTRASADGRRVAARFGIRALAFLFGLLLMWVTEPFFGDHMSDSTKEAWLWPLRIAVYIAVPIAVGWLAKRKGIRIAGRAPTAPKDDA